MLFGLHNDCHNLVLNHVLFLRFFLIFRYFFIVLQVGCVHQSWQQYLIIFVLLFLLCSILLIIVLTVKLLILAAKLAFLLNVDYFGVVDSDWTRHSLLPDDFVYQIESVRWELETLYRIFLGYRGVDVSSGLNICVALSGNNDSNFSLFRWLWIYNCITLVTDPIVDYCLLWRFFKSWTGYRGYLWGGGMLGLLLYRVQTAEVIFGN